MSGRVSLTRHILFFVNFHLHKRGKQMPEEQPAPETVKVTIPPGQDENWITYQVQMRPEQAALLKAIAAREGASPEALAALWLEEKLAEAKRMLKH